MIEPDREQIKMFTAALFCRAERSGFVSLRAFYEDDSTKPFRISTAPMKGGLSFLNEVAFDDALRAANAPKKVVFCPPIAVFSNDKKAREQDIAEGWRSRSNAISVRRKQKTSWKASSAQPR
jgi:hypothetical protein